MIELEVSLRYCTVRAQRGKGMKNGKKNDFITIAVAGSVIIAVILIFGNYYRKTSVSG